MCKNTPSFASVHCEKKSGSVYLFLLHPVRQQAIFFASQSLTVSQFMRDFLFRRFCTLIQFAPQSPASSTFYSLYIKFDSQNVIIHHKSITFETFPLLLLSVINKCLHFYGPWRYIVCAYRSVDVMALVCLCVIISLCDVWTSTTCPMSTLRINVRAFNK